MINSNAAALLNAHIFPAANGTDVTGKIPQFKGGANSATPLKEEIVRIDHNFSDRFSVFGHYIAEQVSQGFAISQWSGYNVPTVGDTFGNPSKSGVIHTTYTIRHRSSTKSLSITTVTLSISFLTQPRAFLVGPSDRIQWHQQPPFYWAEQPEPYPQY